MPPIQASEQLLASLELARDLPTRTKKSRSEAIVFPILAELRKRHNKFFTIYSGETLDADSEKGLRGECDFILTKDVGTYDVNYPIIQLVEAKRNDIEFGVAQCAAQVVGAKVFNQKKALCFNTSTAA